MGNNDGNQPRYAINFIVFFSFFPDHEIFSTLNLFIGRMKTCQSYLDRLDGVYQRRTTSSSPIEKRLSSSNMLLLLPDEMVSSNSTDNTQSKKKKVRWADIEENALHLHKRAGSFNRIIEIYEFIYLFIFQLALLLVKLNKIGKE